MRRRSLSRLGRCCSGEEHRDDCEFHCLKSYTG
jgi:hypothetical protein